MGKHKTRATQQHNKTQHNTQHKTSRVCCMLLCCRVVHVVRVVRVFSCCACFFSPGLYIDGIKIHEVLYALARVVGETENVKQEHVTRGPGVVWRDPHAEPVSSNIGFLLLEL